MRLVALFLLLAAYIPFLQADVSVYINSGADPSVTPDGTQDKPYLDFTTAYKKNISTAMTSDNITVIFVFSETPYNFTLNYVAQDQDDFPYNITFQSDITDPLYDEETGLPNCTIYPSLAFVSPPPSFVEEFNSHKLRDAPGEALIFKSALLNMAFQNLNLTVFYGDSDENPLASLGLVQASSYLNFTINNVCVDFNNASILNTTTDSIFAIGSGAQINASIANISINASVNIQATPQPPSSRSNEFDNEATTKMLSLFQFSANPDVSQDHVGLVNITNITLTQAINCTICDDNTTTTVLQLSTFLLTNTPNLTISNSSIFNLTSNITTYLIYFSETQKAEPALEDATITQSVIYLYNTTIWNATNTTFISSKSGSLALDFNLTNLVNVTITNTTFITIGGSDLDENFALNFTDFNLTESIVTDASLFSFDVTVGKKIHSTILITDLQVVDVTINNTDTTRPPFIESNYPLNVDGSLFMNNVWENVTVFKGIDIPSNIFNVSNTTFSNETYTTGVLFAQAHGNPASLKPSVVFNCSFNTLNFQTASSFISNSGFQFIFDTNILDTITVSDGKFSDNNGLGSATIKELSEYNKNSIGVRDVPDDCKKSCFYLQVSQSNFNNIQLSTAKTPLFNAARPSGATKGYISVTANTFNKITVSYPFIYAANIYSVDISHNTASDIEIPMTVLNVTGLTTTLNIDSNDFSGVKAQDFLYFTVPELGPSPDVTVTSNTLQADSVYTRSFMTITTPSVKSLKFSSNSVKETQLVCPPSTIQAKGVSMTTSALSDSTFEFQTNSFESVSLTINGDRTGYLPDFTNTMFDLQISSSSTISVGGLAFTNCNMDAVFSSLVRIGGDQFTLDSLNIQGTGVSNLDFSGAVNIVANSFTITNSEFSNNTFKADPVRYGFVSPVIKLENPIAQPDTATSVTITGVKFDDPDCSSQISGYFYINLPNINLNIDQLTLQGFAGRYFYVNSETVQITVGDITYQAIPGSTILYMGQGSAGSVTIQKYQDSPADGVLSPAFYFENGQGLTLAFSGLTVSSPNLLYVNLNNSQVSMQDVTVKQSNTIAQNTVSVQGDTVAVTLQTMYFTGSNAPTSTFFTVGSNKAQAISVTASSILAQSSKFASLFDVSLAPATTLSISNSVFDKNVFTVANYGSSNSFPSPSPNDNIFSLSNSILTSHLGSVLQTANSGSFGINGVIVSGTNNNENLAQNTSLFGVGLPGVSNPTPPGLLINDSTIQGIYHPKLSGIIKGQLTATKIGATNFVNNSFFNSSASSPVYGTILDKSTIAIENTNYLLNAATYSASCLIISNSDYSVRNSNFLYNIGNTGGAVSLSDSVTYDNKTIQSTNNFTDNVAVSGSGDVTSNVDSIMVTFTNQCQDYNTTIFSKYINDNITHFHDSVYNVVDFSLFAWNCKVLTFTFLDINGKAVQINPDLTKIVPATPGTNPIPSYQCSSTSCNLIVSSLQTPANIDSLILNFAISQPPNQQSQNSLTFNFKPRPCLPGEYTASSDNKCRLCPVNYYSADNSSECQPCSITFAQGMCLGGDLMSINKYNWREPNSSVVYQCPDDSISRCAGGIDPEEQCSTGYAGALCLHCDPSQGYSPSMTNTGCSKCSSSTALEVIIAILLFVAGLLFEIFYIVVINAANKASLETEGNRDKTTYKGEKYRLGAYLGLAVSNLQILYVLLNYMKFLFPDYASRFQIIAGPLGFIASPSTFGRNALECVLADSQESAMVIFKYKVYVESFLPVAKMIFIAGGVMLLFALDRIRGAKNLVIVSIFSVFMLEQTPTFLNMMKSLSCFLGNISPPGYVKNDLRISCDDSEYLSFRGYFIVPTAIFWSGFLLLVFVGGLFLAKKKLQGEKVKRLFGDFVNNFMEPNFYWGLVIITMKLLLIVTLIMITDPVEAIIPGTIIFSAYYFAIQYLVPHKSRDIRKFDKLITLGFIAMMVLAIFANNSREGTVLKVLGSFAVLVTSLAILVYILLKLFERIYKYWKSWRQYKSTHPLGSGFFSVEDPLEALNP